MGRAAVDLVLSAARLDPDAIWLMMHDLLLLCSQDPSDIRSSHGGGGDEALPKLSSNKGKARASSSSDASCSLWPVTQSMREDEGRVKAARHLMKEIESISMFPWHDQVPSAVPDW